MALFFESKAYLRILGYEKLSLTDLMDPEKEKLAIILSYIISHLSFRKIPWEKAHALFQKNYVILRNASNVMQEYHLGEQTVEEMKYTYERFKQEIEEYRQNNGFLLEELKNFQKRGKEFAVELEHLKTSQQQIITNLEEYKEMIASETERLGEYVSRSKYNLESTQKAMQMYTENSKRSLESIHETENWLEKWEIIHQRFKDDISVS
ncbi:hypothetical protein G6F56_012745 [Rhizopus delemar]|nr:hypothetical protein G6F56_012745 [Rhizopus delemar]